jgi:hypothetical protein
MQNTIAQYLGNISASRDKEVLQTLLAYVARQANTVAVRGAGLEIAAGGSTLAQVGSTSTFVAVVGGRYVSIAAGVDMPALTGLSIAANTFNVACFFVNAAGTVSVRFGTQGATAARVVFPDFPLDAALIGFAMITHSSAFTGGTTPLDTATTVYVSPVGAFDPSFIYN